MKKKDIKHINVFFNQIEEGIMPFLRCDSLVLRCLNQKYERLVLENVPNNIYESRFFLSQQIKHCFYQLRFESMVHYFLELDFFAERWNRFLKLEPLFISQIANAFTSQLDFESCDVEDITYLAHLHASMFVFRFGLYGINPNDIVGHILFLTQ
jgi:hypothetical protein